MRGKLLNPSAATIPVVRELAVRVGVNQAIVLQQIHFRARLTVDGWVERTLADWHRTDFPFWSERTVRRVFEALVDAGLILWVDDGARINYGAVPDYEVADNLSPGAGQSVSRVDRQEEKQENGHPPTPRKRGERAILKPDEEPIGLSEWLAHHVDRCTEWDVRRSVPRSGTSYRSTLARRFAELVAEGYELEDFKLASDGVLADEFMRDGGHTAPDNVLRKTKIAKRIDEGRAWRERAQSDKYARFG